jgi:hypothetical protein
MMCIQVAPPRGSAEIQVFGWCAPSLYTRGLIRVSSGSSSASGTALVRTASVRYSSCRRTYRGNTFSHT